MWTSIDRGRGEFQRALDHLARIDRRMVDRADALRFVGDQAVLLVEEQDPEFLAVRERHRGAAIVDHLAPRTIERRFSTRPCANRCAPASTILNSVIAPSAMPSTSASRAGGAASDFGERAESRDQLLGERLDVAARNGAEQHQFDHFVVGERLGAGLRNRWRSRSRWP